jgi:hypothetical protein
MSKYCWLCDYNCEPEARKINKFLSENAGSMGVNQMAVAVHGVLKGFIPDGEGIEIETIKEHINMHTLMPAVRVANILRSLLGLNEKLSTILSTEDEEGNLVIDSKNVNAYLKVTNEIMQMYRSGNVNRLLFSDGGGEPGPGAGSGTGSGRCEP